MAVIIEDDRDKQIRNRNIGWATAIILILIFGTVLGVMIYCSIHKCKGVNYNSGVYYERPYYDRGDNLYVELR